MGSCCAGVEVEECKQEQRRGVGVWVEEEEERETEEEEGGGPDDDNEAGWPSTSSDGHFPAAGNLRDLETLHGLEILRVVVLVVCTDRHLFASQGTHGRSGLP